MVYRNFCLYEFSIEKPRSYTERKSLAIFSLCKKFKQLLIQTLTEPRNPLTA